MACFMFTYADTKYTDFLLNLLQKIISKMKEIKKAENAFISSISKQIQQPLNQVLDAINVL